MTTVSQRVEGLLSSADWKGVDEALPAEGYAVLERLLPQADCDALASQWERDELFRSRIVMERHGYGRGEYRYFSYPLPDLVSALRSGLYARLVAIADRWNAEMKLDVRFPVEHGDYITRCHAAGQPRPTPLLLRYGPGDYNCLHQDLYGEQVFPLQVAILLCEPDKDFRGGEFVMTEQRPRRQSRPMVVPLRKGDAVVFAVQHRPVRGSRGSYRVALRHGVSTVRSGRRLTAGIIFHDAK